MPSYSEEGWLAGCSILPALRRGGNEVVDQIDNFAGALDLREVPDPREHLNPTSRPGGVRGVGVLDRDDFVLVTPDGHGGQVGCQMQPV